MGVLALIRRSVQMDSSIRKSLSFDFSVPYYSISLSLNVLLTLMIVLRLVLHGRNIGAAMGSPWGFGGLYKTIIAMLIESSALYAVSSVLVVAQRNSGIANTFLPILCQTQVSAFPQPQSSGGLTNPTDWTGHRFTAHHQTGCKTERVDGQHCRHWTRRLVRP